MSTIYHYDKVYVRVAKENKKSVYIYEDELHIISCVLPSNDINYLNHDKIVQNRLMSSLGLFRRNGKFVCRIEKLEGETELLDDATKIERGLPLITYRTKTKKT